MALEIMRTFVFMRKIAFQRAEIWQKMKSLEEKYDDQSSGMGRFNFSMIARNRGLVYTGSSLLKPVAM